MVDLKKTRIFTIMLITSLLSFTLLDWLQIGWFTQWDGMPIPYFQQIIAFISVMLCRTIVAQIVSIKLLNITNNWTSIISSLLIYGTPVLVIQMILGLRFFPAYVPVDLERTFIGSVIGWFQLAVIFDFSRLLLIYFLRTHFR